MIILNENCPTVAIKTFDYNLNKIEQSNFVRELFFELIYKKYGIKKCNIIYDKHGKPFFEEDNGLFFSFSHTKKAVACAVHKKNIGVDIEEIRDFKKSICKRVFTKEEIENIKTNKDFFYFWTMKEAFVKMNGKGLSYGLKNVKITDEGIFRAEYGNFLICSIFEK